MKTTRIKQGEANYLELPYTKIHLNPGDVVREGGVGVDARALTDWNNILHVETAAYSTGVVVIYGESRIGDVLGNGATVQTALWVEVRVQVSYHDIPSIWFEGAVGHTLILDSFGAGGPLKTPGPVVLPFLLGEVPDIIDVFARGRRGGDTITSEVNADEILNVVAATRFRK